MTTLADQDYRPVRTLDDVKDLFAPVAKGPFERRFGMEEEIFFMDGQTMRPPSNDQSYKLFSSLEFDGKSCEPATTQIEHISKAIKPEDTGALLREMTQHCKRINEVGAQIGLTRSPFATLPHLERGDIADSLIRPTAEDPMRGVRQRHLMAAFPAALGRDAATYPIANTSVHYTVGVRDMEDDLIKGRRAEFLMPFILTVLENRPPYNDGVHSSYDAGRNRNHSMEARSKLGLRGGIDRNYFYARSADDLARLKFDDILRTPMFAFYKPETDAAGNKASVFSTLDAARQKIPTFKDMIGTDLGFRSNFFMARSLCWRWLKSKNLYDENCNAHTMLQERRDVDPGIHQVQSMALILSAVDFNEEAAKATDELLRRYGLAADLWPDNGFEILQRSYDSALHRGDTNYHVSADYMDIPYGTGNMWEFAAEFLEILKGVHQSPELREALEPLEYIIETGNTDAQVLRRLIRSPEDLKPFMEQFDQKWFENPNTCLGLLAENGKLNFGRGKPWARNVYGGFNDKITLPPHFGISHDPS